MTPFPATLKFDLACWLGVKVGADPELAPRIALTSNTSGFYADSTRIAGTVPDNALTGAKIATNQVVKSINGLKDAVTLSAGQNISIVLQGNSIGISATGGGNVSSSGSVASGQMAFWNSASTITADPLLTWDNTNNRLGVNIAAPQTTLDVSGTARASLFSGSGASLTDVPPPPMKYGSSSSGYQLPTDASKVWTPMLLSFTPKISGYVELTYGFSFEWSFGAVSYSQIGVCVSTSNTTPTAGTSLTSHVQIGHMTGVANGSTFKIPVQYSTVLSVISGTTYYVWMGGNLINANTSSSVYFVYPFVVAHLYSSSGL